jgi:RNA polymerase sigma-70 factor (ECF subfamily)
MVEADVTRASLLFRVKNLKDERAWGQFLDVYLPMVERYCRRRGLQESDARDIGQEVMGTIAKAIERFEYDPARGKFRDWLFTVTRSRLNDFFARRQERGSGRTTIQERLDLEPGREEAAAWEEDCRRQLFEWVAARARAEFEERSWRAFFMAAIEGKDVQDASSATGLSTNAVYIARSRVLARMKAIAAELGDPVDL